MIPKETQRPSRRAMVASTALAGIGTALAAGGATGRTACLATFARPIGSAGAAPTGPEAVLRSGELEVRVDTAFPRIVSYTDRSTGAVLYGEDATVRSLLVDGTEHTPQVTARTAEDRIAYTLTLDGGTRIDAEIAVSGWIAELRVTRIADTPALRVGTLAIPGLRLIAVRDDQPGAAVRTARIELDKNKSGDTHVQVSGDTPADTTPARCAYAVLATDRLGAAVETNTSYDKPSGADGTTWENGRLWRQAVRRDGHVTVGVGCGQWTHRAATAPVDDTDPLPYAKVILTRDRNDDGTVDWQDAAIALREIMVTPRGADEQHLRVVPHIPFNFASQATNPFLTTLDNVKRICLATDGLRQFTLLKGYQSEGHDSAHPDYGGNYNKRAGGLEDLNALLRSGKKWNSDFGVHVNATESYPVAHAFSEKLVDKTNKQWDWLDQSYRIDQRRDLVSGDIVARFKQLRDETDPALDMLYIDVFRESGWTSDRLQRELHAMGWKIGTEFSNGLERSALWSHWATETNYGPDTSRGINSQLIRFVRNHQKDVFADKWPTLLGIPRMGNFEGWTGKTDWPAFYRLIWTDNLPAKYLQAQPIKSWSEHEITFFGPGATSVSNAGGSRKITTDGRLVYDGGTYLLPWEPRTALDPGRLYHYNPRGGSSTWRLPRGWEGASHVVLYRLTDQGRVHVTDVPVRSGSVTLEAEADRPYVLYRKSVPAGPDPDWGQHTPLHDPGFNSGSLDGWQASGPASVRLSEPGDYELVIDGGEAAAVGQRLARLAPGSYAASVDVEVGAAAGERREAALEVRTADGVTAANTVEVSTAVNYVAADRKQGTRFQRLFTWFTVPEGGGAVQLTLRAAAGAARVRFDNVRVVAAKRSGSGKAGTLVFEDFENVPHGWGPFVKGEAGGSTDPRTHIAQRHAPYTQRGWNGKVIDDVIDGGESLKSRGENGGLVYRTVPQTVRFQPGRRYRVSFRYENEAPDQYAWVTGVDGPGAAGAQELSRTAVPVATEPKEFAYEFETPAEGDAWVGLRKVGRSGTAEFSMDAFAVEEIP